MPIEYQKQYSNLSHFIGVDMATGEPLPEQVWSNKVWTTGFADALSLTGLTLSWSACTIYAHGQSYAIPAGMYTFAANPTYSTAVIVWLDPASADNLAVDELLLDGLHEPPAAPTAGDDFLRLAWGTIGAGAAEFALRVLRHVGG